MTRATMVSGQGRSTGRYYAEVELVALTQNISARSLEVGLTRDSPLPSGTSTTENGAGIDAVGVFSVEGVSASGGPAVTLVAGDVIGLAIDFNTGTPDNVKVWISRNGTFVGNPVAGTGFIGSGVTPLLSGTFYVAVSSYAEEAWTTALQARLCAKAAQLNYTPPTGFSPWEDT